MQCSGWLCQLFHRRSANRQSVWRAPLTPCYFPSHLHLPCKLLLGLASWHARAAAATCTACTWEKASRCSWLEQAYAPPPTHTQAPQSPAQGLVMNNACLGTRSYPPNEACCWIVFNCLPESRSQAKMNRD
ncbi:hypothetical protein GQ54DRAFT_21253 [Martensiomyces pterosporus]|nr:hypothetical protein GQ54DRAFT_21253 [Martensiomyces pterosporus]